MGVQLLVAAVAVGLCSGLTIQREQRKFIYQDGHPSVRRYPVYPERHSSLEQTLPSVLDDIKNELEDEAGFPFSTTTAAVSQPEGVAAEVPQDDAPSTDISLTLESESTSTTPVPVNTSETFTISSTSAPSTTPSLEEFSFTPKPISVLDNFPGSLISPEDLPRETFFGNDRVPNDGSFLIGNTNDRSSFIGEAPVANDGSSFILDAPLANDGSSFGENASVANDRSSFIGDAPVANDESSFIRVTPFANDGSSFTGNAPVANNESSFIRVTPFANDGSSFIGNAPVANDGSSFIGDAPLTNEGSPSLAFGSPDSFFGHADGGHREVFTANDARPVDPSLFPSSPVVRVPAFPSSFGVFPDTTEEISTDFPLTTDVINNFLAEEEEEEVTNFTRSPLEEVFEGISENVTDVPDLDRNVTDRDYYTDIPTTEETEAF